MNRMRPSAHKDRCRIVCLYDGGVRKPVISMGQRRHVAAGERAEISHGLAAGRSYREITTAVDRARR